MTDRPHCQRPESCSAEGARGSAHCRSCAMKATRARMEADPVLKARHDEAKRRAWADPEVRRRKAEAVRAQWADPEQKAAMLAKRATHPQAARKPRVMKPRPPVAEDGRANMAAGARAAWRDPVKRAAMIEGRRRVAAGKPKAPRTAKARVSEPRVTKPPRVAAGRPPKHVARPRPKPPPRVARLPAIAPEARPISTDVLRWAGWFLAAGWRVGETAALFGLTGDRLGDALDRPDKLERAAA